MNHELPLDSCRAFVSSVSGDWRTQPRTPGHRFGVNYCFYSPTAELSVRLANRTERIAPHTLCWFPPGIHYEIAMRSTRRQEPLKRLRFRLHNGRAQFKPFKDFTAIPRATFCDHQIARCIGAFEDSGAYGDLRRRSELSVFVMNVCESLSHNQQQLPLSHGLMLRMERFVAERMDAWPSTRELARVAGYSPAYFSRLMKQQTGLPPRKWLVDRRIRFAAKLLLESEADIQAIAYDCGYENPFFFSRQFKEVMGSCPRSWRQQKSVNSNSPFG